MCGIAGFFEYENHGRDEGAARARLGAMLQRIRHRGPDDWGMLLGGFASAGVSDRRVLSRPQCSGRLALGHQRLSILDLSEAGRQPMISHDGRFTIVFNGEIYNYIELRQELAEGAEFRTGTDTEVLMEAYRRWGTSALSRLDGMFAFAIWDELEGTMVCARDPLGIKPFYYAEAAQTFFFGSEPGAVLAGMDTPGQIDRAHVAEFIALGLSDHDDGTFFREVRQLPGGHWLQVTAQGVSAPTQYWHPPTDSVTKLADVATSIRDELTLAVSRQLRSDVPVGSCLSGGLDSGSIVATIGHLLGKEAASFRTVTLTNPGFEGDEAALAELSARRAGVGWVSVTPAARKLSEELPEMVRVMGEPFSTLSMFGQYRVFRAARAEGLKVMLDGQGGDEVFLGYPGVALRAVGEYTRTLRLRAALRECRDLERNASQSVRTTVLANLFMRSGRLAGWRNSRRIQPFVNPEVLEALRPATVDDLFANRDVRGIQIADLARHRLPRLLRYEDRNSMAFGLEARVPLLAVGLVEMALRLPLEWKVRNGWPKFALRAAMEGRVPAEILWHRQKHGYEVPQKSWVEALRPELGEWFGELGPAGPLRLDRILSHIDAGGGGAAWLWRCISVALWMRFSGVRW